MDKIEHYAFGRRIVATLTPDGWSHDVYERVSDKPNDWEAEPFSSGLSTLAEARSVARHGDEARGLAALRELHPEPELTVDPELEGGE